MKKEFIKPPLVLMLICLITCGLLVIAYEATYIDNTGVITDKLSSGLSEIYGTSDGFEMLKSDDGNVLTYDGITSIMKDNNNNVAFEVIADGYSKGGLHILVGITPDGNIKGISIISIGETPGLGTKVQSPDFLNQFKGVNVSDLVSSEPVEVKKTDLKAIWGSDDEREALYSNGEENVSGFKFDAITGATYSSKGIKNAVTISCTAYAEKKGEIIGE